MTTATVTATETVTATAVSDVSKETSPVTSPERFAYRHVWIFLDCSAVALAVAGWIGGALTFSGSNFFFALIERQNLHQPFGRYSTAPFQFPALVASSLTSNVAFLWHLFGLSYAVAPFGALLASWLIVRRRAPHLMVWPAIGITIICLPGLMGLNLESPIVGEWAWPLLLLTLVALDDRRTVGAAVVVSAFIFFCSANSLGVFVLVAVAALARAWMQPVARRRLVAWAVAMLVAAPLEYVVRHSDFSSPAHKVSADLIGHEFKVGYFPLPFIAYVLAGFACAVILYLRISPRQVPRFAGYVPAALVGLAGLCLVVYSSTDSAWRSASEPKDILLLLEIPLFAVACFDHLFSSSKSESRSQGPAVQSSVRVPVLLVAGVSLLACLGLWSASWSSLMNETSQKLSASTSYCISVRTLEEPNNALASAYTQELALVLQGRTPAHVPLGSSACRILRDDGILNVYEVKFPAVRGWFHFER